MGRWQVDHGYGTRGFFVPPLPEQLRSHIEDAEQTPLTEFRLDGSTTVCPMGAREDVRPGAM